MPTTARSWTFMPPQEKKGDLPTKPSAFIMGRWRVRGTPNSYFRNRLMRESAILLSLFELQIPDIVAVVEGVDGLGVE